MREIKLIFALAFYLIFLNVFSVAHCNEIAIYKKLISNDPQISQEAYNQLRNSRKSQIKHLIKIIERDVKGIEEHQKKVMCIDLLGEMRAAEAVNVILKRINIERKLFDTEPLLFVDAPGPKALISIGKPSVKAILDKEVLVKKQSSKELRIFAKIIEEVEGSKMAESLIKSKIAENKDSQIVNNLEIIFKYLKCFQPN